MARRTVCDVRSGTRLSSLYTTFRLISSYNKIDWSICVLMDDCKVKTLIKIEFIIILLAEIIVLKF